ncbi:MAG: DUF385 domain-containing protein [Dehalococcoidia bacterium]|nr:DUF385 domain-containing protein [Dehalococcoidia bacterium]
MNEAAVQALRKDRLIDITTIGRKSGKPHRKEFGFFIRDGKLYLTGRPGKRSWYANLLANPNFTLHLKQSATMDLPAVATPIRDPQVRRAWFTQFGERWPRQGPPFKLDEWVAGSPLVEVTIQGVTDSLE